MERRKLVAAVLTLLSLAGVAYWAYPRLLTKTKPVLQATGTIEATSVELTAKTAGTISMLKIEEGDTVIRGQLVAELSRNDLVAQRERDAMALLKAENQLKEMLSGARVQERDAAAAEVRIAEANLEKATADLERRQLLYDQGAVTREELDRYKTNLEVAKNQLQAAQARLSLLEAGSRPEAIATARAEVERSRAVLKATDAVLQDLKIYSPITGVVVAKNYQEGEFVQIGSSVATVADLSHLWIKVYVATDDLPAVKLGQKVHFTVSGDPAVYQGTVNWISPKGEYTPKTIQTRQERANVVFAVKIGIDNGRGRLKPGMPADVTFDRG
ncbi:MAG TPA: HlyD family efflux transporter periplasmic adaptor subunit [Syntrophomonadaceae bacterium]|nr:HlyD family efflux transporter periplasmic adaptor subunit [Syntrophomonadaceae bacterium]